MHKPLVLALAMLLSLYFNCNNTCCAQNNVAGQNQTQQQAQPDKQQILAVSRTSLNTSTTKVGDQFCARMVEGITVGSEMIIPTGSIVCGQVTKVVKPKRLSIPGYLLLSINQINTPDGQTISLVGREVQGKVISPYAKPFKERTAERIPTTAASLGTSIPLNNSSNLSDGTIYAISQGAVIIAGAVTGFFDPDIGKTRTQTALRRAYESTPLGGVQIAASKGRDAHLDTGSGVVLNFDKQTVAKIQNQYYAQSGRFPIASK